MSEPSSRWPSSWRAARPELVVTFIAVVACAVAGYAVAGGAASILVVVVFSAVALGVLSFLLPSQEEPPARPTAPETRPSPSVSFINYWRMRRGLTDAMSSTAAYRAGLGPQLGHVLAARLSERHGVSLYQQPELARSILCANPKDADLWAWVDPGSPQAEPTQAEPTQAKSKLAKPKLAKSKLAKPKLDGAPTDGPGIPPRTLARLVQRMEQL